MKFQFSHTNFNVKNLERSVAFYEKALALKVTQQYQPPDKSFTLVYLGDDSTPFMLELTWMKNRSEPYNLGDNEFHLAFAVDDVAAAHERHQQMGCICHENPDMGIYFIEDPDGYWLEILPASMKLGTVS